MALLRLPGVQGVVDLGAFALDAKALGVVIDAQLAEERKEQVRSARVRRAETKRLGGSFWAPPSRTRRQRIACPFSALGQSPRHPSTTMLLVLLSITIVIGQMLSQESAPDGAVGLFRRAGIAPPPDAPEVGHWWRVQVGG